MRLTMFQEVYLKRAIPRSQLDDSLSKVPLRDGSPSSATGGLSFCPHGRDSRKVGGKDVKPQCN